MVATQIKVHPSVWAANQELIVVMQLYHVLTVQLVLTRRYIMQPTYQLVTAAQLEHFQILVRRHAITVRLGFSQKMVHPVALRVLLVLGVRVAKHHALTARKVPSLKMLMHRQ